ncbi:TraB/VirB10 family protein [Geobacter anodireducens]
MEKKKELDSQAEVQRLKDQIEAIKNGRAVDGYGNPILPNLPGTPGVSGNSLPAGMPVTVGGANQQVPVKPGDPSITAQGVVAGLVKQQQPQNAVSQGRAGKQHLAGMSLPPLPPASAGVNVPPPPLPPGTPGTVTPSDPPAQEFGEISIVSFEGKSNEGKSAGTDNGKKKGTAGTSVYLPPSYMEATLLSGAYIPTAESAKGHPMPVLLRIKTPAFLPNEAKAEVKGCYVIADGRANLATERAEMTVVSLSCLDKKGQAVIDQKVKGWLIDSDGVAGIGGKVVAKMGAMVARSLIAGFFGGMGDALKSSVTTTSVSPLGATQSIDTDKVAIAGVGNGFSSGFKEIQRFYLDLAKQTLPAIAILPSKSVTVAISEGTMLEIKPIKGIKK